MRREEHVIVYVAAVMMVVAGATETLSFTTCNEKAGKGVPVKSSDKFLVVVSTNSGVECELGEARSPDALNSISLNASCGMPLDHVVKVMVASTGDSGWCILSATLDGKELYEHVHKSFWIDGDLSPPRNYPPLHIVKDAVLTLQPVEPKNEWGSVKITYTVCDKPPKNLFANGTGYSIHGKTCGGVFPLSISGSDSTIIACPFTLPELHHVIIELVEDNESKDKDFEWCCSGMQVAHYSMMYNGEPSGRFRRDDFPLKLIPGFLPKERKGTMEEKKVRLDFFLCTQELCGTDALEPLGSAEVTALNRLGENCSVETLFPSEPAGLVTLTCPFHVDEVYRVIVNPSTTDPPGVWRVHYAYLRDPEEYLFHHQRESFDINGESEKGLIELHLPDRHPVAVTIQAPHKGRLLVRFVPILGGWAATVGNTTLRKVPEMWKSGEGVVVMEGPEGSEVEIMLSQWETKSCEVFMAMNDTVQDGEALLKDKWAVGRSAPEYQKLGDTQWKPMQGFRTVVTPGGSKTFTTTSSRLFAVYVRCDQLCGPTVSHDTCISSTKNWSPQPTIRTPPPTCRCTNP